MGEIEDRIIFQYQKVSQTGRDILSLWKPAGQQAVTRRRDIRKESWVREDSESRSLPIISREQCQLQFLRHDFRVAEASEFLCNVHKVECRSQ